MYDSPHGMTVSTELSGESTHQNAMQDISRLPHRLDKAKRECQAIIETPKGRRNKFKYDEDSGLFSLSNLLPQGFSFPFDFGFIPSTAAEDGDPLDLIVLMDEAAHVGCLLDVRLIGVIKILQTEEGKQSENDRLVGVSVKTVEFKEVNTISELPKSLLQQITEFLALYNKNSGKHDELKGVEGPGHALELLEKAAARFTDRQKS
jgi:inorganic pyrophosphatase